MVGKLIVIEGTDGAGKATQAKLLIDRLRDEGYSVETVDFPQYTQKSAHFVERYLRGEFGPAEEVGAKRASLFFALDRYDASFRMWDWLKEGKIIISNRYVSANKGHQLGKISEPTEMKKFLGWINELEYDILKIPRPDLTLFLHMPPEIGQQLVDKKDDRSYLQGKKRDIHEADISHLRNAERAYLFCLENDSTEKWDRIICHDQDQPKPIPVIHEEVYRRVKTIL